MKRHATLLTLLVLFVGTLAGCLGGSAPDAQGQAEPKRAGTMANGRVVTPAGNYEFTGTFSEVLSQGLYKALPPVRVFLKSSVDQVDIEIAYHLPEVPAGTQVPVLVHASPYHRGSRNVTSIANHVAFLHHNFLPHGYAVAAVAIRGTANSGGCMDLMGNLENKDLDQAITWLGTQPWSNGNVSMSGVSYDGSTPWSVAAWGNPHLKTIVPISGVPDLYGLMYRNGSAEGRGPIRLNHLYYEYGWHPGDAQRTPEKRVQGVVCPESFKGFVAAPYSGYYGERDPLGYWAERNRKPLVEQKYKGSILSVQGLQDWNVDPSMVIPWGDELNQTGLYVKQVLGQWGHSSPDSRGPNAQPRPTTRYDWAENLLRWFDYWLKGQTNIDLGPSVEVQDHTYRWRAEERFPPQAEWRKMWLVDQNKLSFQSQGPVTNILLTPAPLYSDAPQVKAVPGYSADFYTGIFANDTIISGLPRLHITVIPSGPTGHLAAHLYVVNSANQERVVGHTQMNLLFADGSEKAKQLTPNQPILAKMEFQPLDFRVRPDERLLLRVWESTDHDRLPAYPPGPVTLRVGGGTPSNLELPIVTPPPSAFFTPPMPADYKWPE